MSPTVNADRLWQSLMDMARIGPIPGHGNCRLALTPEDAEARALFLGWCQALGLRHEQDAIGNMFLRRDGSDSSARAVAFGSHLDTVPTGGRFDGPAGVLAGLEVLRTLQDSGLRTRAPLELVNWTNEEGSRFHPAMMGSRVAACAMPLEVALAVTDPDGVSVAQALDRSGQRGSMVPAPRDWSAWLELHIEQGPVMEATGTDIGIVTGAMNARYFNLNVIGEPSHVGTTALPLRKDSLAGAAEIVLAVERIGAAAEPDGRASATWIENTPNARGNVPHLTRLHCDVRHVSAEYSAAMEVSLRQAIEMIAGRRRIRIEVEPYATFGPVVFDAGLGALLRRKASERQLTTRDMTAAAGHDSVFVARGCPSAMLFVPSVGGITHNPAEFSTKEQVARGAQVLLDAVWELAG